MKQSIAWHEECLYNQEITLREFTKRVERDFACLQRMQGDFAFYAQQIHRARMECRDGFDREKYGKKRGT